MIHKNCPKTQGSTQKNRGRGMIMHTGKMLIVSTSHLPEKNYLQMTSKTSMTRPEGDLLYVATENSAESNYISELTSIHINLKQLIRMAWSHKCCWILFDRDADSVDDLPTFEW